jgi:hypothetical protein
MPDELAKAIDRFLGGGPGSVRMTEVRRLAHAAIEAWRDGHVPTSQALRALNDSHEAMCALDRATRAVA